jgi:hypothetical protein
MRGDLSSAAFETLILFQSAQHMRKTNKSKISISSVQLRQTGTRLKIAQKAINGAESLNM